MSHAPMRVEVDRWRASHFGSSQPQRNGSPRGFGNWMFENQDRSAQFSFNGAFAQACRAAVSWARANGHSRVHVCP